MINNILRYLLFIVGFTLPLQAFSLLNVGGFRMTPSKLAAAALLGLAGIALASGRHTRNTDRTRPWILFFAVTFTLACIQGFLRGVPLRLLLPTASTYYALFLFYFLIGYVVTSRKDLATLLWGLILGGVTSAAPAVFGFQSVGKLGRYYGLAGQANTFGLDLTVVVAVALAILVGTRVRIKRGMLFGAILIAVGGIFLSLSRTAFVCGLAMWGLWMYRSRRIDTLRYAIPAVVLLVGALMVAPATVTERFDTMLDPQKREQDGSIQSRFQLFELGSMAFASSPVVGIGLLSFVPWANSQPGIQGVKNVIHNSYLSIAVDQGLLGLVPYLMILFLSWQHYSRASRAIRARRRLRDPVLSELAGYAMFLQIGLFSTIIAGLAAHPQKSKTAWLMLALAPVVYNLVRVRVEELQAQGAVSDEGVEPLSAVPDDLHAWSR